VLVRDRGEGQIGDAVDQAIRACIGDASVDRVHDPADSAAPVAQSGRTPHHLDALSANRVETHGVIGTGARGVEAADAVFEDSDAVAPQATDDWPAGAGTEVGGVHSGHRLERSAQGRRQLELQALALHHGDGTSELGGASRVDLRSDDDQLVVNVHVELQVVLERFGAGHLDARDLPAVAWARGLEKIHAWWHVLETVGP
jgi:hypothetical protein